MTSGSVRHYVNSYKSFSEDLTNLLKLARSDHMTQGLADEIETLSNMLQFQIQQCEATLTCCVDIFSATLNPVCFYF